MKSGRRVAIVPRRGRRCRLASGAPLDPTSSHFARNAAGCYTLATMHGAHTTSPHDAKPPRPRNQPLPEAAREQPRGLVSVGAGGAGHGRRNSTGRSSSRIGYSACHWCHVMEHESFEDEATAQVMNEHFVCIKVDREERPDLDTIYMNALQVLTREGGGWPLSVFLTPDLTPFYAGTYYPPDDRYAPHRPSFRQLLLAIDDAWTNRRDQISRGRQERRRTTSQNASELAASDSRAVTRLARRMRWRPCGAVSTRRTAASAAPRSSRTRWNSSSCCASHARFNDADRAAHGPASRSTRWPAAACTISSAAASHRYSIDAKWLVPHFEKMLYDNALLTDGLCRSLAGRPRDPFYEQIARETLDYVLRR